MKYYNFSLGIVLIFIYSMWIDSNNQNIDLQIKVENLRNNKGHVGIRIFKTAKGFPTERDQVFKEYFVQPKNNVASIRVRLPKGVYAIGSIHDENSNKELDKNFLGIPKEGLGTSNNPKIRFGPPTFDQAKFKLEKEGQKITIKMNYF